MYTYRDKKITLCIYIYMYDYCVNHSLLNYGDFKFCLN